MNTTLNNLTTPNTWLTSINAGVDYMFFNYLLIGIWVLLVIAFSKRDEKKSIAAASLITGVLATIFYILGGLVGFESIGISLLLFIIGVFLP